MSIDAFSTIVAVMLIAVTAALMASRIPRQLVPVVVIELSLGFVAGPMIKLQTFSEPDELSRTNPNFQIPNTGGIEFGI